MNDENTSVLSGTCFCNAVRFQIMGPLRDVINCHCSQCTQLYGNYGSHTKVHNKNLEITKDQGLTWYRISEKTRRGFCSSCGSGLFWKVDALDTTCVVAGSLENPTGLKTTGHVFIEDKADFYEITDEHPQFQGSSKGALD